MPETDEEIRIRYIVEANEAIQKMLELRGITDALAKKLADFATMGKASFKEMAESMIALSLTDSTSRVPSLSRELYDVNYNANTRYGLGDGQAFVDGELALATLLDDLQDPNNDFSPIDINVFFAAHDFVTEAGLIDVMDDIFNTFSFESVNRLYFKFVQDAFTTQPEFADLFKTSWVALQGTQIFQTEDQFTG